MSGTTERLQQDIIAAMKAKDSFTTTTLRLAKSAIQSKAKDKQSELTEDEVQAVFSTMVKQRKDSIQQFADGGRIDLAMWEASEIDILAKYMPQEIGKDAVAGIVKTAVNIFESDNDRKVTPMDIGVMMKAVQAIIKLRNERADGKLVNQLVREALA